MDNYKEYFEDGVFSTQGKLVINSGNVHCHVVQINDVHDDNSFGKPFIDLLSEFNIHWEYLNSMDKNPKIDFFDNEFNHVRKEVWEIIKKSPKQSWLIFTKESPSQIENALPFDWGIDRYPNVWIAVFSDEVTVDSNSLPEHLYVLSSSDTLDPLGFVLSGFDNNPFNSCLWVITCIDTSDITYEIQYYND